MADELWLEVSKVRLESRTGESGEEPAGESVSVQVKGSAGDDSPWLTVEGGDGDVYDRIAGALDEPNRTVIVRICGPGAGLIADRYRTQTR